MLAVCVNDVRDGTPRARKFSTLEDGFSAHLKIVSRRILREVKMEIINLLERIRGDYISIYAL